MGTEEKNTKQGFFGKNEGILLISSNYNEKQQIEDGLNRTVQIVDTTEVLVDAMTNLSTDEYDIKASVILTKETPPEIRQNFSQVIELLELTGVNVFEIKIDKTVKDAYRFHSITDFLKFARNQRRKERISNVKDEEQRTILEEMQVETNEQKEVKQLTDENVLKIKIDKTIKDAYRFHSITDFLKLARNQRRKERISHVKDEEQRTILEELQVETDAQKEVIQELEGKIKTTEEE